MSLGPLKRIKVCGVTSLEDARKIVNARESCLLPPDVELLIGMILWPSSVRSIDLPTAKEIVEYSTSEHAVPVGVFVDETRDQILSACEMTGLRTVQFHGAPVRGIRNEIPSSIQKINVVDVLADGSYLDDKNPVDEKNMWTLFDAKGGGTGKTFDWSKFKVPASKQWMLAGGLGPENVTYAVKTLQPPGLDVASGVCTDGDRCRKDYDKLVQFFEHAMNSYTNQIHL
jgi:phosphoribosylanthranilate isomerase